MMLKIKVTAIQLAFCLLTAYLFGGVTFPTILSTSGFAPAASQLRLPGSLDTTANVSNFSCNVTSALNSTLLSPATGSLDGRFYCAALQTGTDKIYAHHYQYIYSLHLQHLQLQQVKLLEIGLGCNMPYGPGRSVQLWEDMFSAATSSFLEFNASCASDFRPTVEAGGGRMYSGSQDNATLLQQVVQDAQGALYDIIIDDGGHLPDHQLMTLQHLWPALKSGGVYIIEDVMTHFMAPFQGISRPRLIPWLREMMDLLHCNSPHGVIQDMMAPAFKERCSNATQLEREVLSIDCMVDACVLVKAVPPTRSQMELQGEWVEKQAGWPQATR